MSSILSNTPLDVVLTDKRFVLKGVKAKRKFANGAYTDEVIGYSYDLVNLGNYDHITVTVPHTVPIITAEELMVTNNMGTHVMVEVEGAIVSPYVDRKTLQVRDSIKATNVRIIHE